MNLAPFLAYTAIGATIWTAQLAYLGYLLGSSFRQVGDYLDPASWVVSSIIAVIYVVRVIRFKGRASLRPEGRDITNSSIGRRTFATDGDKV